MTFGLNRYVAVSERTRLLTSTSAPKPGSCVGPLPSPTREKSAWLVGLFAENHLPEIVSRSLARTSTPMLYWSSRKVETLELGVSPVGVVGDGTAYRPSESLRFRIVTAIGLMAAEG